MTHARALKTSRYVKEARLKGHIVYDPIYMKCPEEANLQTQK